MTKGTAASIFITDEQIVELFWQRDETAIQETRIKYGRMLFRIAYNILHDTLDCEECQNDTYLRVWNAIPPSRPTVFSGFLATIVRNIAIDRYKEKASKKRIPSELTVSLEELCGILPTGDSPEDAYAAKELSKRISDYIRELPKRRQFIFIRRFYFGDTIAQIASEIGISNATVQRETERLKEGLRDYFRRNGVHL